MLRNNCFESKSGKTMRQRCINQSYVLQYGFEDDKWKYWTDRIHTECHTQSILSKAETNSTRTVEEKRGQNGLQWSIVISQTKDRNYISKLPNIISQFLFILINYWTFLMKISQIFSWKISINLDRNRTIIWVWEKNFASRFCHHGIEIHFSIWEKMTCSSIHVYYSKWSP